MAKTTIIKGMRNTMTMQNAKDECRDLGMTIRYNVGCDEYRVNFKGGTEATAYYTNDRDDAVLTARAMMRMQSKGFYGEESK